MDAPRPGSPFARRAASPTAGGRAARRSRAPVLEVFRSWQGEGRYLGQPQVFVRLRGCPLRCRYCDTPHSWTLRADQRPRVGESDAPASDAPTATAFQVACWIAAAEAGATPHAVSLTGGEPLVWPGFLRQLATLTGERRLHLETAGAHPRTLAALLGLFHHVSLDLKLPGDLDAAVELEPGALGAADVESNGQVEPTDEPVPSTPAEWSAARRSCLDLLSGRDAAAKLVATAATSEREAFEAIEDLAEIAPDLPLFIQPATPMPRAAAPEPDLVRALAEYALELDLDVRVVPQMHRALDVR